MREPILGGIAQTDQSRQPGTQVLRFLERNGGLNWTVLLQKHLAYRQPGQWGIGIIAGGLLVGIQGCTVFTCRLLSHCPLHSPREGSRVGRQAQQEDGQCQVDQQQTSAPRTSRCLHSRILAQIERCSN